MSSDEVRPGTPAAEEPAAEPADGVASAVLGVPGVHSLHGGIHGEVATYLPGRRVLGVRLLDDRTAVHVAVHADAPVRATIGRVRDAVRGIRPGPVDVTVEDLVEQGAG